MAQQKTTKSTRTSAQRKPVETKATYTEEQSATGNCESGTRSIGCECCKNILCNHSSHSRRKSNTHVHWRYVARLFRESWNFRENYKRSGIIEVPKKAFMNEANRVVDSLLQSRKLLVIDGLTEDERTRFGVSYKENELLNEKTYQKLLDLPMEELSATFKLLCEEHKKIVAKVFYSAAEEGDHRVSLEKVRTLNDISKQTDKDGLFKYLLQNMAEEISK